jgi:hypothetical protein
VDDDELENELDASIRYKEGHKKIGRESGHAMMLCQREASVENRDRGIDNTTKSRARRSK